MAGRVIAQGASLGLKYGLEGDPELTGWSCRVMVKASPGASAIGQMDLTQKNDAGTRFVGLFSRDATNSWEPGDYKVYADLWNPSTGEAVEIEDDLRVKAQGVPNA